MACQNKLELIRYEKAREILREIKGLPPEEPARPAPEVLWGIREPHQVEE